MNYIRIFMVIGACIGFSLTGMALNDRQQGNQRPFCLSLGDALQRALAINLQVMMANARLEQAIARISEAQSDLLPHIDGIVSGGRQTADLRAEGLDLPIPGFKQQVGPFNTFNARPRLTLALFDPSAFERFQAAKKGESLSQADLDKTREDVLALVASLYTDAQRKQQTVKVIKTLLDRDMMSFELGEKSYIQGTETLVNSSKLNSDLAQTKYLYQQAKKEALDALLDLEAALQIPLNRPLVFLEDKDLLKKLEKDAAIHFKDDPNADMVVASSTLEARKADQKTAYADFLPKISGTADYGRSGESPTNGSNTYFVGVQASVPIWEGGAQQAKLKEVKGEIKEAQANYLDAAQQEQVNLAKARDAIVEASDLKQAKAQARQTAQRSLLIAFHAQEIGTGTVFELMQAKANLALAEDDYNEALATWVMAHIDLLHAQGRLRDLVQQEGD